MENHFYWVSAITYAVVLGILLYGEIKVNKNPNEVEKSHRMMLGWVVFFCVQDAFWGLCEAKVIQNDIIFFVSSSIFHMSTVVTTFFWLKYVLDYLGDKIKNKKIYLIIDGLIVGAELVLILVNCFHTTLFRIEDGTYITGNLRTLTFLNQYVVYLIIGITALVLAIRKKTRESANYKTIFLFAIAPIVLGVCQLLFPDGPFYSLGYFLGCVIMHVFIVMHDREIYLSEEEKLKKITELNESLKKKQTEINAQFDILKSISAVYNYINMVDLSNGTAYRFDDNNPQIDHFDIVNDPHTALNKHLATTIDENHYDRFMDFTNLSKLNGRMKGKKLIVDEYRFMNGDWIRAMYIRIGENVNSPVSKVAYAYRDITKDRKREEQVYAALTKLVYSLHMFDLENDTMERLIESEIFSQIVGNEESAQKMSNTIIKATCKDEYLDFMLKFVDLSTISERMEGHATLTSEFVGKFHGWTRMTLIPIEMNKKKIRKLVAVTEIIDSEKNELMNLIYKSSTDELTRLYNRRTYEEELDSITASGDLENLAIVAMDVNGLKTVNDTIGHKAGDELIIGASNCIGNNFNTIGKAYRTGGDEFMAILRCKKDVLAKALEKFDKEMKEWSGNLIKSLSISYGYVWASEYPKHSIRDLASEADKRMYEAKSKYYRENGIERRRTS